MAIFLVPFVIKQLGKVSSVSRIPGKEAEHLECDFAGLIARFDRRAAALRGQANLFLLGGWGKLKLIIIECGVDDSGTSGRQEGYILG